MTFGKTSLIAATICLGLLVAAAPPDIPTLEAVVNGLLIAKSDPDTDAEIKTALLPVLKKKLASLQTLLENAIKQLDGKKNPDGSAIDTSFYKADLKLILWLQLDMLLDDNKGPDAKKLLKQWKDLDVKEAKEVPGLSSSQTLVNTWQSLDSDGRFSAGFLKERQQVLGTAIREHQALICREITGLRALHSDDSLTKALQTKTADRIKALLQKVPAGRCP